MTTRILLADDSITIHKVVRLTFAAEDVEIEAVTDGEQALEKARVARPDIVLADVFMPAKNGYELCAAIKSDSLLALTPVVLLVGTFEPFDESEAARVKCNGYLTKPFDTSELIQIVRHLAKEHDASKAALEETDTMLEADHLNGVTQEAAADLSSKDLITDRTRASFLGAGRILDLFDFPDTSVVPQPAMVEVKERIASGAPAEPAATLSPAIPFPADQTDTGEPSQEVVLSDQTIDRIVSKVVRRISEKAVREIAWEVVPEVSEIMIRQYIDQLRLKKN